MVDNCSYTARLGSRKWAPRFDYILDQQSYVAIDQNLDLDQQYLQQFLDDPVHKVRATVLSSSLCFELRDTCVIQNGCMHSLLRAYETCRYLLL